MKDHPVVRDAANWLERAQSEYQYMPGMEALRAMCARFPGHDDENATVSKLWVIGRSHSAALERVKPEWSRPDLYPVTARRMGAGRLDKLLSELRAAGPAFSVAHLEATTRAVDYLAGLFHKTTGQWKHSLASKYLHFHDTRTPILDSIARGQLSALVRRSDLLPGFRDLWDRDGYGRHVARMAAARKLLRMAGYQQLTARRLDIWLLYSRA